MDYKNFIGPAYNLRNAQYSCQTCVNWYVEAHETASGKGFQPAQLTARPGMLPTALTTLMAGSRGGYVASNNTLFWVFGNRLYRINTDPSIAAWTSTLVGEVTSGTDKCIFTDNGFDLFIVAANAVWTCPLSGSTPPVQQISGLYSQGAGKMTFLGGYVIFTRPNSNVFYWTNALSTVVDGSNFASAEANPDQIVGIINNSQALHVFGRKTIEIWAANTSADIAARAFVPQTNALIETGCIAPATVKKMAQTVAWLSADDRGGPMLVLGNGYAAPVRVSTFPLEQKWATFSADSIASAYGDVINFGGHVFYVLTFRDADETYVYDHTASQQLGKPCWHTWQSFDGNGTLGRWAGVGLVYFNGFYVTGDADSGTLCVLDADTGYDISPTRPICVERAGPVISSELRTQFFSTLTLDFAVGTTTDLTLSPKVLLQISDDGGRTWSDERWEECGQTGQFGLRVQFDQLGSGASRVFRIRGSDNQYWALCGAYLSAEEGMF